MSLFLLYWHYQECIIKSGVGHTEKTLWPLLIYGFNCLKATKQLWGGNLLFTTQSSDVPGTQLMDFRRMKHCIDLTSTYQFWTWNQWIGNPVSGELSIEGGWSLLHPINTKGNFALNKAFLIQSKNNVKDN